MWVPFVPGPVPVQLRVGVATSVVLSQTRKAEPTPGDASSIGKIAGKLGQAIAVTKSSGIETYEDLRGRRVAYIKGSPALNVNTEAYLAYAGLTWDDVEAVEFGGSEGPLAEVCPSLARTREMLWSRAC